AASCARCRLLPAGRGDHAVPGGPRARHPGGPHSTPARGHPPAGPMPRVPTAPLPPAGRPASDPAGVGARPRPLRAGGPRSRTGRIVSLSSPSRSLVCRGYASRLGAAHRRGQRHGAPRAALRRRARRSTRKHTTGSCTGPLRIIISPPKLGKMPPNSTRFGGGKAMVSHLFYYQLALLALIWLWSRTCWLRI